MNKKTDAPEDRRELEFHVRGSKLLLKILLLSVATLFALPILLLLPLIGSDAGHAWFAYMADLIQQARLYEERRKLYEQNRKNRP